MQLKAKGERNFSLGFEFPASLGHRGALVFEWMDLPIQPLCNAIHVIPADEVTLTQWFLRPPTTQNNQQLLRHSLSLCSPNKEKKKSKQEADSFKNVKKDRLASPVCHRSQRNTIHLIDLSHAPEKAQLFPCQGTQTTFVGFQLHGESYAAIIFLFC